MSDNYHYEDGAIHHDHKKVLHIDTMNGGDIGKLVSAFFKDDAEEAEYKEIVEDEAPHPEHTVTEELPADDRRLRNEERFHFVHPEVEDDEAWRIHDAVKRLVAHQRVPEICAYLKELKQKGKVMLPSISAIMYNELVRLGMPTGEGFSEKHFSNSYTK